MFPAVPSLPWERRIDAAYGSEGTHYLSLADLIAAKTSAGRPQDRADLEHLVRAQARKAEG